MVELLKKEARVKGTTSDVIKSALEKGKEKGTETSKFIHSLYLDADGDMIKFKAYLEEWFDDTMERAAGWYKKWTQVITFFVGFGVALSFNVDTIKIVDKLSKDPKVREQYVQFASSMIQNPDLLDSANKQELNKQLKKLNEMAEASNSTINIERDGFFDVSFLGLFITAIALSLGAPFWFDLLNKLIKLRGSIPASSKNVKGNQGSSTTDSGARAAWPLLMPP